MALVQVAERFCASCETESRPNETCDKVEWVRGRGTVGEVVLPFGEEVVHPWHDDDLGPLDDEPSFEASEQAYHVRSHWMHEGRRRRRWSRACAPCL